MTIAYKNAIIYLDMNIAAGQNISSFVSCAATEEGAVAPRRIILPEVVGGWVISDIGFEVSEYPDFSNRRVLYYVSNGINAEFLLPQCIYGSTVPLPASYFDAIPYIRINCKTPQAFDTTITLACQPIYQAGA